MSLYNLTSSERDKLTELEFRFKDIFPPNAIDFYLKKNNFDMSRTRNELLQMEASQRKHTSHELQPEEAVHLFGQMESPVGRGAYTPSYDTPSGHGAYTPSPGGHGGYTPSYGQTESPSGHGGYTPSLVSDQRPHHDRYQSYGYGERPHKPLSEEDHSFSEPSHLNYKNTEPEPHPRDYRSPSDGFVQPNYSPVSPYNNANPLSLVSHPPRQPSHGGTDSAYYSQSTLSSHASPSIGRRYQHEPGYTPSTRQGIDYQSSSPMVGRKVSAEAEKAFVIQKQREQLQKAREEQRILIQQLAEAKKGLHDKVPLLRELQRYNSYSKKLTDEDIQYELSAINSIKDQIDNVRRWRANPKPVYSSNWSCKTCHYINSPGQHFCEVCKTPR